MFGLHGQRKRGLRHSQVVWGWPRQTASVLEPCNHIDGIMMTSIVHELNIAAGNLESVDEEALEILSIRNSPIERFPVVVCRILVDSYDQSVDCFQIGWFMNWRGLCGLNWFLEKHAVEEQAVSFTNQCDDVQNVST